MHVIIISAETRGPGWNWFVRQKGENYERIRRVQSESETNVIILLCLSVLLHITRGGHTCDHGPRPWEGHAAGRIHKKKKNEQEVMRIHYVIWIHFRVTTTTTITTNNYYNILCFVIFVEFVFSREIRDFAKISSLILHENIMYLREIRNGHPENGILF